MLSLSFNRDYSGRTSLLTAVYRKEKWEVIRELLNPLSVRVVDFKGNSCLHYILQTLHYEDLDIVREFLNHGADVNIQNNEGNTALHLAARHIIFRFHLMKELLDHGGDPNILNEDGDSPLHIAVRENCSFKVSANTEDIKNLLDSGADPNIPNGHFLTPMHIAVGAGYCHTEIIELLISHGACVSAQGKEKIIHSAVRNPLCSHGIIRTLVFENPLLLNCNESYKGTPLHLAVALLRPSIIDEILRCGGEVNTRDGHSNTPLHIATQNPKCDIGIITTLLTSGAIVNCYNYFKCSPLLEAARLSYSHVIEILLCHGADVNAVDVTGNSSLHYAVDNEHMSIQGIRALLEYGANPDATNNEQVTPLYYCRQKDYAEIIIQYTVLKNFHEGYIQSVIHPEKILDLSALYNFPNYAKLFKFRDLCIYEITQMEEDKIEEEYSLYDYVLERCFKKKFRPMNSDISLVKNVISKLKKNNYSTCKDVILGAMKTEDLLSVLLEKQFYTNCFQSEVFSKQRKIILNLYTIEYLVKYLSKQDLMNLAIVFYDNV